MCGFLTMRAGALGLLLKPNRCGRRSCCRCKVAISSRSESAKQGGSKPSRTAYPQLSSEGPAAARPYVRLDKLGVSAWPCGMAWRSRSGSQALAWDGAAKRTGFGVEGVRKSAASAAQAKA
eukprot:scaffold122826_cov69-Phaeocystis_antarctica.AAC.2